MEPDVEPEQLQVNRGQARPAAGRSGLEGEVRDLEHREDA